MANRTVLLIDYEPRSIEDTRRPLEEAGYVVEIASDGVAGLEAFHRVHPDLVLVEAMLPKKHGFDVCQEIKNSADGKDTPVVITTGVYRGRKYRNQALQNFGCDEYLEKPFTDDALLEACDRFIAREVAERATEPGSSSVESPEGSGGADAAVGRQAADGDDPRALDLERMTEDEISSRLDSLLADFGEAVDAAANPPDEQPEEAVLEAPGPETTPVADGRESIFDTASQRSDSDGSAEDPPEVAAKTAPSGGAPDLGVDPDDTVVDPDAVPVGPASAVFAESTDGRGDSASAADPGEPVGDADLIPTLPVAGRGPARDAPEAVDVGSEVRTRAEVAKVPTKSTVLESRPADPARRRWLVPVVAVVVLGAIVTAGALWMRGRQSGDDAPAVASREPVTFAPSAAARAGFADDGLDPTDDGPVASAGVPPEAFAVGQDPSVAGQDPVAASPAAEPEGEPAVKLPDPEPVVERVTAARSEPPPAVEKTVKVAEREPAGVPAATRPDPAPVKVAAPVAAAEPPPAVETSKPATATASTGARPTGSDPGSAGATAPAETVVAAEADPVEASPVPSAPEPLETESANLVESTPRAVVPAVPEPPPVRAGDLLEISEVDTEPVALSKPAPRYNAVAKQANQQGDVVLNVLVDENGAVADVNVLKGIEGSMLDDAAVRAIRKWTYEPATKDGVPVKVWTMEIISFRL